MLLSGVRSRRAPGNTPGCSRLTDSVAFRSAHCSHGVWGSLAHTPAHEHRGAVQFEILPAGPSQPWPTLVFAGQGGRRQSDERDVPPRTPTSASAQTTSPAKLTQPEVLSLLPARCSSQPSCYLSPRDGLISACLRCGPVPEWPHTCLRPLRLPLSTLNRGPQAALLERIYLFSNGSLYT